VRRLVAPQDARAQRIRHVPTASAAQTRPPDVLEDRLGACLLCVGWQFGASLRCRSQQADGRLRLRRCASAALACCATGNTYRRALHILSPRLPLRFCRPPLPAVALTPVRDLILRTPLPQHIFICNIDICSSFPFTELLAKHSAHRGVGTILGVNVPKDTATRYGCIVSDPETKQMLHYVEKPESWISNTVNGGVYRESASEQLARHERKADTSL
jgi:hypothetical protein